MELGMRDILFISPELVLVGLGILVVLLDLVVGRRKGVLLAVATWTRKILPQ